MAVTSPSVTRPRRGSCRIAKASAKTASAAMTVAVLGWLSILLSRFASAAQVEFRPAIADIIFLSRHVKPRNAYRRRYHEIPGGVWYCNIPPLGICYVLRFLGKDRHGPYRAGKKEIIESG